MSVSSADSQNGHLGDSARFIVCRCLFRGAWPVRSCVIILLILRLCTSIILRKPEDGTDGSISRSFGNRGDAAKSERIRALVLDRDACLAAATLYGSVFRRSLGSCDVGELCPSAARFASLSAASFPCTPVWPCTQAICNVKLAC